MESISFILPWRWLWSHEYSGGAAHFVATDCDPGEKVVIPNARELLGEGGSLLQHEV